jgi:hypothetical protein
MKVLVIFVALLAYVAASGVVLPGVLSSLRNSTCTKTVPKLPDPVFEGSSAPTQMQEGIVDKAASQRISARWWLLLFEVAIRLTLACASLQLGPVSDAGFILLVLIAAVAGLGGGRKRHHSKHIAAEKLREDHIAQGVKSVLTRAMSREGLLTSSIITIGAVFSSLFGFLYRRRRVL